MTIRHIVVWKLAEGDREARVDRLRSALEPLAGSVPSVRSLVVVENAAYPESNHDIALIADFDDVAGLEAYQVHPEHVAAAAIVRANVASRAAIDFAV